MFYGAILVFLPNLKKGFFGKLPLASVLDAFFKGALKRREEAILLSLLNVS